MKKFMPIIISIIVTAVVSSGATYAILNISDSNSETNAQVKVEVENEEPEAAVEVYELDGAPQTNESETAELDLNVEIKSAKITQDSDGKSVAIVTYVYTNLDDSAESFSNCRDINVYQNGVALNRQCYSVGDYELKGDIYGDVKPGSSSEIEMGYELNDNETDLLVEIRDTFHYDRYLFARTFYME